MIGSQIRRFRWENHGLQYLMKLSSGDRREKARDLPGKRTCEA